MVITDNRWRDLVPQISTEAQVRERLGDQMTRVEGVRFGAISDLTLLSDVLMATSVYVQRGKVLVIAIAPNAANQLSACMEDWREAFDAQAESVLASRIDKNSRLHLYAAHGLALHEVGGRVEVVEIFPAMSVNEYINSLYVSPPIFRK